MQSFSHKKHFSVLVLLILALCFGSGSCTRVPTSPRSSTQAWEFAVLTDTQGANRAPEGHSCINDGIVHAMAKDLVRENPDFVLVAGDLVNGWFRNGGTPYSVQYQN